MLRSLANQPEHCAATLVDDRCDRYGGTKIVIHDRDCDALRHLWRRDKRKIRFVERAPIAPVNEHERAARRGRGEEKVERFLRSGTVAQIELRTKSADSRLR